jgi:hypothetical protein
MPSKGSLETLSKRAMKAGWGGAGAAMIGCSPKQEQPTNLSKKSTLHAAIAQKNERRERIFKSLQSVRNTKAVFFIRCSFVGRVRGKALQVPYVLANGGGVLDLLHPF